MEDIKLQFDIINTHMSTIGWKHQSDEVDEAIGLLSPAQIVDADEREALHKDLIPYLSTYHVSWLFEATWAMSDNTDNCPDDYDPTIPFHKIVLWALADRV